MRLPWTDKHGRALVKIPPSRIPANYRREVENQLQKMLDMGVIEESSSPWMVPMVFIPKKSGELRLCVDYRELNKRTVNDAYPLPRPDEVQDHLAVSTGFSTLDLQHGYGSYQQHRLKTAFCPVLALGCSSFVGCPLACRGHRHHFNVSWMRFVEGSLLLQPTWTTCLFIPPPRTNMNNICRKFSKAFWKQASPYRDGNIGLECHR